MANLQKLYLYRGDFVGDPDVGGNPRDTEDSRTVVRYWFNDQAIYAVEEIPDARCLHLVAERLVVRRILGLANLDAEYKTRVSHIETFGQGTPLFSELERPEVFVAMTFVPLTPGEGYGYPRLARLYCVSGLTKRYALRLEGMEDPALRGFSWFLEGVPLDERNRGIVGRSWLLAAHLLVHVASKRDLRLARKLAREFIITGDVCGLKIRPVNMGRKNELVNDFKQRKWMIPMENEMIMSKLKIRKPSTIEEAERMLEGIGADATASLSAIVDSSDASVESCLGSLKSFADPNAVTTNNLNALGHFEEKTQSSIVHLLDEAMELMSNAKIDENKIASFRSRMDKVLDTGINVSRLLSYYGSVPQMYFSAAHWGDVALLKQLRDSGLDIDATDSKGMTALDFALEVANDAEAAMLLRSFKAKDRRGIYEIGSDCMQDAMRDIFYRVNNPLSRERFVAALNHGLSPNTVHVIKDEFSYKNLFSSKPEKVGRRRIVLADYTGMVPERTEEGKCIDYTSEHQSMGMESCEVWDTAVYELQMRVYSITPYFVALASGDDELISLCEAHGADAMACLDVPLKRRLRQEFFAASDKDPIVHEWSWKDEDFAPWNRNPETIQSIVRRWPEFSQNARDSVSRTGLLRNAAKK